MRNNWKNLQILLKFLAILLNFEFCSNITLYNQLALYIVITLPRDLIQCLYNVFAIIVTLIISYTMYNPLKSIYIVLTRHV